MKWVDQEVLGYQIYANNKIDELRKKADCKNVTDFLKFRQFLAENCNDAVYGEVDVENEFANNYERKMKSLSERDVNILEILATQLDSHRRPIIPGSTLKGAIRTAILDYFAESHKNIREIKSQFEPALLKQLGVQDDNFKHLFHLLKISDFHLIDGGIEVCTITNKRKKGNGTPQQMMVIKKGSTFSGSFTIADPHKLLGISPEILKIWSPDYVMRFIQKFSQAVILKELQKFSEFGYQLPLELKDQKNCPIKLGNHAGAYAHTLEGYERIEIKAAGKMINANATIQTTYWACKNEPMGWANLSIVSDAEFIADQNKLKQNEGIQKQALKIAKDSVMLKIKAKEEAEQLIQAEKQKLETDKFEKQNQIAKMANTNDPNEWAIWYLKENYPTRQSNTKDAFNNLIVKLQSLTETNERKAALFNVCLTDTLFGKEKLKDMKKRAKNGEENTLIKLIKSLCPNLFTEQ